jgi:hypothetical protein
LGAKHEYGTYNHCRRKGKINPNWNREEMLQSHGEVSESKF